MILEHFTSDWDSILENGQKRSLEAAIESGDRDAIRASLKRSQRQINGLIELFNSDVETLLKELR